MLELLPMTVLSLIFNQSVVTTIYLSIAVGRLGPGWVTTADIR